MNGTIRNVPSDADYALAKQVAEWMESLQGSPEAEENDYMHNLSVYGRVGSVTPKAAGIVASAIVAFNRDLAKRVKVDAPKVVSNHVGTVKERLTLELKLVGQTERPSEYGVSVIHKFEDTNGNRFTWFGSKRLTKLDGSELEVGEPALVKATIKAHAEYKGVKETHLNRVEATLSETEAKASKAAAAKAKREAKKLAKA